METRTYQPSPSDIPGDALAPASAEESAAMVSEGAEESAKCADADVAEAAMQEAHANSFLEGEVVSSDSRRRVRSRSVKHRTKMPQQEHGDRPAEGDFPPLSRSASQQPKKK